MTSFWQDLRYGLRMIAKAPWNAAIIILTMALGIGANTTIFTWINSTLLNPIPGLGDPSRVVALSLGSGASPFPFTYPDFDALNAGQQSFTGLTACGITPMSLTGKGKPERIWGMVASANYFDVLQVKPALGRGFLPSEDTAPGGAPVAVISYRFWRTHFGGDPGVLGKPLEINQQTYTIVGVAPAVFQGSQTGLRSEIWIPLAMDAQLLPQGELRYDHHYFWMSMFGRLKPGVTARQAQQEMTLRLQPEVRGYPDEHRGHSSVVVYPLWRSPFSANQILALLLPMLMAIAGIVLLLACANVASLTLVRAVARRREMSIRLALGASRERLVRQLLVESMLLALAGGAVALLMTLWTASTFMRFLPEMDFPIALQMYADHTVLLAGLGISLFSGVLFGILPAGRSARESPAAVLKEDGGNSAGSVRKAWLTRVLVVAQISLSVLLLVCAGLFIRSFQNAQRIDPGMNPHHVLIASYDLYSAGYSQARGTEFDRQLVAKLAALPGIEAVTLTNRVPLALGGGSTSVKPEGYDPQPNESMETQVAIVTPHYFRTLQIPLTQGRDFTDQDTRGAARVTIVSEAFARRYWPNQPALGKRLNSDLTHEWFTVVGVARDGKQNSLNEKPLPFVYLPLYQVYRASMTLAARTTGDPMAAARTVEGAIHELNGDLVVFDLTSLEEREQLATFPQRIAGTFVGAFGLLALVLAALGIYGVTAYTTRQRTREIGIRMALGAGKRNVMALILGQGMLLTAIGLGLGLAVAFAAARLLNGLLLGVTSTDALTYFGVALLLCAVALAACLMPARRAMRVDPNTALRSD